MDRFRLVPSSLIFFIIAVLAATAALASTPFDQKPLASGFVSEVNQFTRIIAINGGQIMIDASQAQIRGPLPNETSPFSAIRAGVQIAVVFAPGSFAPGQAIPATIVQVLRQPVGTMTGKVESVDIPNRMFRVNGQWISVKDETRFGSSVASLDAHSLAELPIGKDVTVFFDGNNDALVAHEVFIIAPIPDEMVIFNGIVKQIKGNTWSLINSRFDSFKVTSRTALPDPPARVGDQVSVLARIDDGQLTAEFVEIRRQACPVFQPNPVISTRGILIARDSGSITVDNGTAVVKGFINNNSLFDGGDAVVGDNVEMKAEKIGDNFVVKLLTRFDYAVPFTFIGTLKEIDATKPPQVWTIESSTVNTPDDQPYVQTRRVIVDDTAKVTGGPKVGDKVISLVNRAPDGTMTAISITKDPHQ